VQLNGRCSIPSIEIASRTIRDENWTLTNQPVPKTHSLGGDASAPPRGKMANLASFVVDSPFFEFGDFQLCLPWNMR
jgi:hypothetical protein